MHEHWISRGSITMGCVLTTRRFFAIGAICGRIGFLEEWFLGPLPFLKLWFMGFMLDDWHGDELSTALGISFPIYHILGEVFKFKKFFCWLAC